MDRERQTPRMISDVRALIVEFLKARLDKAGIGNIVPSHGEILYNLILKKEMTMTELSKAITKDRSTVTALVGKLEKKKVLEYIDNPADRRSKKVRLTDKGESIQKELISISEVMNEKLWQGIDEDEKLMFINILDKMKENFSK